jgi:hypothetical protein
MVLQREDVPAGLRLLEEDTSDERGLVEPLYDPRAEVMFLRVFERPREEAEPGSVVCIMNSALLYKSPEDAKMTYREVEDLERASAEIAGEQGREPWEEVPVPGLGDESRGLRAFSESATFCPSYKDEPAEEHAIVFLRRNVAAGLFVFTYEGGGSLDEAIGLAQKQANRIEEVFEGESSD